MHYNYWVKWLIILRFYGKYGYLEIKSFSSSLPCIPLFFTSLYSSLSLLFLTFLFHTFSFPSSTHSFLPDPSTPSFPYIPFVIYLFPSLSFLVSFLLFVLLFLPFLFAVPFPYLPLCFFPSSFLPLPFLILSLPPFFLTLPLFLGLLFLSLQPGSGWWEKNCGVYFRLPPPLYKHSIRN